MRTNVQVSPPPWETSPVLWQPARAEPEPGKIDPKTESMAGPAFLSLAEAVAANVADGDIVAMEGFTHLIPYAAGHEVIRQKRRNLTSSA